jgi:PAS domain S-box-containing protein
VSAFPGGSSPAARLALRYVVAAGSLGAAAGFALAWSASHAGPGTLAAVVLFAVLGAGALVADWRERLADGAVPTGSTVAAPPNARTDRLLGEIAERASEAIFVKDLDGRYLLANAEALRLLGRPLGQVIGFDDTALFPAEHARILRANDLQVMQSGRTTSCEETIRTLEGDTVFLSTKGPVHDEHGRVIGMFGIARDITARQRAEDARRASEEKLRLFIEHTPAALAMFDRDMRYLAVSRRWLQDYGLEDRVLVDRCHYDIFPEIDARWRAVHARALDGQVERCEEECFVRADGREQWLRWEVRPWFVHAGEVGGIVIFTEDLTATKRDAAELERHRHHLQEEVAARTAELERAKTEAESATKAKSVFLANMSHELRTPLGAIVGLTRLLGRESSDAGQAERLHKISFAAQHLLGMIDDILDLSRIDARKVTLRRNRLDVAALLSDACSLVADSAQEKGLELVIDADPSIPEVEGDGGRLAQALINYLGNAVKFTDAGSIVLRARCEARDAGAALLRFEVADTGVGIEPLQLDRLFQPFEQADSSTVRRHHGTGLGLAITRQLAELMGGSAGAQSIPGEGSTFWFTARLAISADPRPLPAPARLAGLRACVVEGNPYAREALSRTLQALGFAVQAHPDAASAMCAARDGEPIDVLLAASATLGPEPGGFLAGLRQSAAAPIGVSALLSTSALKERDSALAAGYDEVLQKPLSASCLRGWLLARLAPGPSDPAAAVPPSAVELRLREQHPVARVLLAEDDPVNREVALDLLSALGWRVDIASQGEEAVDRARENRYDLILMDLQMPVLDGTAAAQRIRALPGAAQPPILAMTADRTGEARADCLAAGMNDCIDKPVDPEQLFATLERWLA